MFSSLTTNNLVDEQVQSATLYEKQFKLSASQNEVISQSVYLNADEATSPKQKNQSTSPNLPLNELVISEEEVKFYKPVCEQKLF